MVYDKEKTLFAQVYNAVGFSPRATVTVDENGLTAYVIDSTLSKEQTDNVLALNTRGDLIGVNKVEVSTLPTMAVDK